MKPTDTGKIAGLHEISLNNLPEGWAKFPLKTISTRITKGETPTSYGFKYQERGIRFVKVENLKDGRINHDSIKHFISEEANLNQSRSILLAGDLLFSIAGTLGATCIVRDKDLPANTNQALAIIRGTSDILSPDFLQLQLGSEIASHQIANQARGGSMNNISLADVGNIEVCVPPLAEQKRIVAKVEQLLAHVNAARERLAKVPVILRRFRQAVLTAACSGRLTADWRNLNTTTAMQTMSQTEHSIFGSLPVNWKVVHVHEVATVKGGKRLPKGHQYSKGKTPFPYLRVTDFEEMSVAANDLKYITDITRSKIGGYTISQSDVYISIAGSIGMVGLIPEQLDGASLTENAAKLTELKNITKEFLCYALNSQFPHDQITRLMTSSGQPKLALFRIKKILIPLPPIDEQLEVTNNVKAIFQIAKAIENRVSAATAQVQSLTQSILAKAFYGELVPTEAELAQREGRHYEPAYALLTKIKVQRKDVKSQRKHK